MHLKHSAILAAVLAVPGLCAANAAERPGAALDSRTLTTATAPETISGPARFLAAHPGTGFAENHGRIERVYGAAFGGGANPVEAAASFINDHATNLWGLDADQLLPIGPWSDQTHVLPLMTDLVTGEAKFMLMGYIPHVNGVPVYDSALRVLVRNEPGFPVVLASAQVPDVAGFSLDAPIMMNEAVFTAEAMQRFADAELSGVRPVVFAGVNGETAPARAGVEFILTGSDRDGNYTKFKFIADPATGAIIHEENQILHADVTVQVQANKTDQFSMECGSESASPLPHARVTVGGTTYTADANGVVTIPNAGTGSVTVSAEARTTFFNVDGGQGDVSGTFASGTTGTLTLNNANSSDQQRAWANTVYFAEEVRNFTLAYNSNYPTIANQTNFTVNTGVSGTCNAYYDGGSINFYNAGGGCANTAFDVIVHHEYGHHLVATAGSGQGEYGEGSGDCMGVLITGDSRLAVGFYQNQCGSGIRNANNGCSFSSTGCSSCGSAIHTCGQLLSGMVWEVRDELIAAGKSTSVIEAIFVNSMPLHNGTSINSNITIDWLTLDDDNGNILDGTPNYAEINAGCTTKGVPGPELELIAFNFPAGRPDFIDPSAGASFPVQVVGLAGTPNPGSGRLRYRIDGGAWTTVSMPQTSTNYYTAAIPAVECESSVDWYVYASAIGAGTFYSPSDAPASSYAAIGATDFINVYGATFESNSTGWTVTNDAALTSGAWERGNPTGTSTRGEPDAAAEGSVCFVTENGNGNFDIDGGCTTVTSPTFDASNGGTTVSYIRWFDNTGDGTGASPNEDTMTVQVSSNNGATWVNAEVVGPATQNTGGWIEHSFLVGDFVANTATCRVRFTACDTGSGSVVEAGLDDFRVTAVECAEPPALLGDINGDCIVDGADLGLLVSAWGTNDPAADLDGNGTVNGGDLGLQLGNFGATCP